MLTYPQLSSGALSQLPVRKRRRCRTVVTTTADGRRLKYSDSGGGSTEWRLDYESLSDAEANELQSFFEASEGSLASFTFLDPTGNLFAWSDELLHAVWTRGPMLQLTGGVADPLGGQRAWSVVNAGGAPQSLLQTLAVPCGYTYCISAYMRCAAGGHVRLMIGDAGQDRLLTSAWQRVVFGNTGGGGDDPLSFGVEIPAGESVSLFGLQVEAQAGASSYKATTRGGVYEGARFAQDSFRLATLGLDQNSCSVQIIHGDRI
jgi:hypothetical protein